VTKSAKPKETKSRLPILVGAIAGPILYTGLSFLIGRFIPAEPDAYVGPMMPDLFVFLMPLMNVIGDVLVYVCFPMGFGAIVGIVSRLIAKTPRRAIWSTLIVLTVSDLCVLLLTA
jgi:hypothetical protein